MAHLTTRAALAAALALAACGAPDTDARDEAEAATSPDPTLVALDGALGGLDSAMADVSTRFDSIDNLLTAQETRLRRYLNAQHLERARRLGVGRVDGQAEIDRLVGAGRLVHLEDTTRWWRVQPLDLSVAYVTPDTRELLEDLGRRFQARLDSLGLPMYRYTISSVLRTGENQADLRRINPNAARGTSTHEFGATLDIVYHKYSYLPRDDEALHVPAPDGLRESARVRLGERLVPVRLLAYDALGMRYWQQLQGILGRTLIEMQDEGRVLVTLERNQPVFHITLGG